MTVVKIIVKSEGGERVFQGEGASEMEAYRKTVQNMEEYMQQYEQAMQRYERG